MSTKSKQEAQNPLILRCHRLMEAFAKSDDERDFYIDRLEGFLIYIDLDKSQPELATFEEDLSQNRDRYCPIPKLTFYEIKKIMEGFVNEKVYDIDTKEKLLDIIQSKEARENFLEAVYDHHAELEKWQQYYQERSRIRIIEWLRQNHFHFVFEEDLELPRQLIEKVKQYLFQQKVGKDIQNARKALVAKAKTYYSNEALNPRPKRGRPPKQAIKLDIEPQVTIDIYTTVTSAARPFLFIPEMSTFSTFSIFSSKFETEEDLLNSRRQQIGNVDSSLNQKLATIRALSSRWDEPSSSKNNKKKDFEIDDEDEDDDDKDEDENNQNTSKLAKSQPKTKSSKQDSNVGEKQKSPKKKILKSIVPKTKPTKPTKPKAKRIMPRIKPIKK